MQNMYSSCISSVYKLQCSQRRNIWSPLRLLPSYLGIVYPFPILSHEEKTRQSVRQLWSIAAALDGSTYWILAILLFVPHSLCCRDCWRKLIIYFVSILLARLIYSHFICPSKKKKNPFYIKSLKTWPQMKLTTFIWLVPYECMSVKYQ